ncbi:O-antigen/teichoic acid export membrane protein [Bradyrhizobium japonicum]|uniref:O-antigen/teichoic acid export membrane protein n=1 Tax=Bradyrhizobium japonicum TaxID=375 RepID=A0A1Y2JTM6_BRAJP|nr:hypothetical protein [Bradyrhizobium japonicum]OSJ35135.1 hypothetical protein BSZ19_09510 [Bradyrhizobium japonicum]
MSTFSWSSTKLLRYAIAVVGPVSVAAIHLTLSLLMLRVLSPAEFGVFTFLLVAAQFSWGIWSALFCAPLPVLLLETSIAEQRIGINVLRCINWIAAAFSIVVFFLVAERLGLSTSASICFALYGAVALIRWFGRSFAYVRCQQLRAVASDLAYSVSLLAMLAVTIRLLGWPPQIACYFSMLVGAIIGVLPIGKSYFSLHVGEGWGVAFARYRLIWKDQARWALLGVLTTEATANAHVYIVTLLQGPSAFAPIAASSLLMRPINVAQNALTDFERPQMARLISGGQFSAVRQSLMLFRAALAAIWIATVLISVVIFLWLPRLLFPPTYDLDYVAAATVLWTVFAALRLLQTPESALLQAAGEFKDLAMASVYSSIGSVGAVWMLVMFAGALWSIAGLCLGAIIYLGATLYFARKWLRELSRLERAAECNG